MGHRLRRLVVGVLAAAVLIAAGGRARANSDGLVLRAFGFFEGTFQQGTCNVPNATSGFIDAGTEMGLVNTGGFQTISFPDLGNPFARPCGGYLQLTNSLTNEGINVLYADAKLKVQGAKQFAQQVPTRNGFPSACRQFRKQRIFFPARLGPIGGAQGNSGSGESDVVFAQLLPIVPASTFECLREQYASLPTTQFTSFPLLIHVVVTGLSDDGSTFRSNALTYTLTLRHLCGNGRVDDFEECDPNAPPSITDNPCVVNGGICVPPGDPAECTCRM
jgi:hypothetical protein